MADGSADLDGFPVREGETLNGNVLLGFDLRRVGRARPGSIPDAFRRFNYFFRVREKPVPNQWPPLMNAILRESSVLQLGYEALV
jgi:hypothetical protein